MKAVTFAVLTLATAVGGLEMIEQRQTNWTVGQTVQTSSGPVSGHAAKNDSQVSEYLGIPFGQAPVGNLRFAAPVAFNGTAPINGTSFVCPTPPIFHPCLIHLRDSPVL
jgi:cholinesterase